MKFTLLFSLTILTYYSNGYAQSNNLEPFVETEIMGCSCFILEKNKYFENNKYIGVVLFEPDWQDRILEIKINNKKQQLRIDNTNVKTNHFGLKKYYEVYKDKYSNLEIRIDYIKTKSIPDIETSLYDITYTIKHKRVIKKIITKGFCGC